MLTLLFPPRNNSPAALASGSGPYWVWEKLLSQISTSSSGVCVTPDSAMRVSAVLACVRVLSETLAQLPWHVYERLPGGGKSIAERHPLMNVLRRPNQWQTSYEFREMMMGHLALRGNAYAEILPGSFGAVSELVPLHPDRVRVERLDTGRLRYQVREADGSERPLTQDEVFHLRGLSSDGITGLSPVSLARESVGLAVTTERHGALLFKNGARPGVVLETDRQVTPEAAERMRKDWTDFYGGENAHRTAVLEQGLKAHELGLSNDDAQFLETRRFQIEEIARLFRVPLHLIGDLTRSTNNNIEHQSLEFVMFTMMPWIRRWEEAMLRDLVVDNDRFYVRFNFGGLLRGDAAARSAFYREMVNAGIYSINDCLELEDMNPIPNGDVHLVQGAMITLERAINPPEPTPPDVPPEPDPETDDDEPDEPDAVAVARELADATHRTLTATVEQIGGLVERALTANEQTVAAVVSQIGEAQQKSQAEIERMAAETERQRLESERLHGETEALRVKLAELSAELETQSGTLAEAAAARAAVEARLREVSALALRLVTDEARKKIRWEIDAVRRALNKPNFVAAVDEFYVEHAARLAESLREPLALYGSLVGQTFDPIEMAGQHCGQSKAMVLDAATCQPDELTQRVEDCIAGWEARADTLISGETNDGEST